MGDVINVTDRLIVRNLNSKIGRLKTEIDIHIKSIEKLRDENSSLYNKTLLLKEENDELKRLLKEFGIDITYGR